MISKSIVAIALLIHLPITVSGDESLLKKAVARDRRLAPITEIKTIRKDTNRQFYTVTMNGRTFHGICETADTKSGTITYVALIDDQNKIIHFSAPAYTNKHNSSLTTPGFLSQFRAKQPAVKPIRVGTGVDAISGATMSTESLVSAVNRSAAELKRIAGK